MLYQAVVYSHSAGFFSDDYLVNVSVGEKMATVTVLQLSAFHNCATIVLNKRWALLNRLIIGCLLCWLDNEAKSEDDTNEAQFRMYNRLVMKQENGQLHVALSPSQYSEGKQRSMREYFNTTFAPQHHSDFFNLLKAQISWL